MKRLAAVAALFSLVACGGDDSHDSPDYSSLNLTLDPSHVTVTPGATQAVTVNLVRTGSFADAVAALSATTPPPGVTFAFDAASTSAGTATLTISAAADAVAGAASATVTAASGTTNATAPLTITVGAPPTMTLQGKVVTMRLMPISYAEVRVWSHGATTPQVLTTGRDGTFTLTGVTPPYDVVLAPFASAAQTLYMGLTRSDPLLSTFFPPSGIDTKTSATVTLSGGGGFPQPTDAETEVVTNCASGIAAANFPTASTGGDVDITGPIALAPSCDFSAMQIHINSTTGLPDTYWKGVNNSVGVLFNDNTAVALALSATPLPTHDVPVAVTTATAGNAYLVGTEWTTSPLNTVGLANTPVQTTPYSHTVKMPTDEVQGVFMVFQQNVGTSTSGLTRHASASVSSLNVTIPDAPTVAHPVLADGPVDATTVSFSVNGSAGSGYFFIVSAGTYAVVVATTSTSLASSTLATRGFTLPSNHVGLGWSMVQVGGIATMDDMASEKATLSHFYATDGATFAIGQNEPFSTAP